MSTEPTLEPIPYAVTEEGETLTFNPSKDGHRLAVGVAGAGKTAMTKEFIRRAASQGAKARVCDPPRTEFIGGTLGSGRGYLLQTMFTDASE